VLPTSGELTCVEGPEGTTVTHTVRMELRGAWTMFARHLRLSGDRTMALSLAALRRTIESSTKVRYRCRS
jgi:hypothetical protein